MKTAMILALASLALVALASPAAADCQTAEQGEVCTDADTDPSDGSVGVTVTYTVNGVGGGSTTVGASV